MAIKKHQRSPSTRDMRTRRVSPFSLRLTAEERAVLQAHAGAQPLGAYVKAQLFAANDNGAPVDRGGGSAAHKKALAQALAKLGASEMASSMRGLAEAARSGSLPVTEETESHLRQACADVAAIKSLLMRGLRVRER